MPQENKIIQLKNSIIRRLDVIVSTCAIFIGLFINVLSYFFNIQQYDLGIVLILGGITYIILNKKISSSNTSNGEQAKQSDRTVVLITNIIFFASLAASILVLRSNLYYRPPIYFILCSVAAASIGIEIAKGLSRPGLIIIKIIILALSVKAGIFYEFSTLMGADTWVHVDFASAIANSGHVPSVQEYNFSPYNQYPIFHILIAITKTLTSLGIKDALFFSVVSISTIGMIFVFLIGKLIGGIKLGLFGMLIASISDILLVLTVTNMHTGTLVFLYYIVILYIIFKRPQTTGMILIIVIMMATIIMTHQLTVFVTFVALVGLLLGGILGNYVTGKKNYIGIGFALIMIFGIAMISYWMYAIPTPDSLSFFDKMVFRIEHVISSGSATELSTNNYVGSASSNTILSAVLYHTGYLIMIFFTVIGISFWSSPKIIGTAKVAVIISMLLLFLVMYGSALSEAGMSIIPHRWLTTIYPLLALLTAQGIIILLALVKSNWSKMVLSSGILLILTFFMLTTPYVNGDSPIFDRDRSARLAYTSAEVQAASTLANIYSGTISIDRSYNKIFQYIVPSHNLTVTTQIPSLDDLKGRDGIIVLRSILKEEPTTVTASGTFGTGRSEILGKEYFKQISQLTYVNLVYNDKSVLMYSVNN